MTAAAPPGSTLRPAGPAELAEAAALYWQVWHETHAPYIPRAVAEHRDRDFFRRRVEALRPPPLVTLADGRVLGFVAWQEARLDQLWIAAEARGGGLGASLLAQAESAMAAAGSTLLWLDCMARNEGARRFYERHGWRAVRRFDKPLGTATGEVGVPVWRMEKALARPDG